MILYAEDTKSIAKNVISYLELEGFSVDRHNDWNKALQAISQNRYDCYILDIMLPWIDGQELCQHIRKKTTAPIIMTTAKWEIWDKKTSYNYGADDYLVKPFALEELVLRIQAITKRSTIWDQIEFWDVIIYTDENMLTKAGIELSLPLKERQILIELIEWKWMTVPRAQMIDTVWWWEALFENNDNKLDVYIANLRKKIGKEYIETIKWVGYKLNFKP